PRRPLRRKQQPRQPQNPDHDTPPRALEGCFSCELVAGSLCGVRSSLVSGLKGTTTTMLRKLLAALFLFAFVVASAQESSGTSTVALSARRPAPTFSLEWRDPHTGARVTEWNIGDCHARAQHLDGWVRHHLLVVQRPCWA